MVAPAHDVTCFCSSRAALQARPSVKMPPVIADDVWLVCVEAALESVGCTTASGSLSEARAAAVEKVGELGAVVDAELEAEAGAAECAAAVRSSPESWVKDRKAEEGRPSLVSGAGHRLHSSDGYCLPLDGARRKRDRARSRAGMKWARKDCALAEGGMAKREEEEEVEEGTHSRAYRCVCNQYISYSVHNFKRNPVLAFAGVKRKTVYNHFSPFST